MSLRALSPWLPWPQGNHSSPIVTRRVYCERIICVHDDYAESGWWHDLEHADELLFTEGGRIVESNLEGLAGCVEEAVEKGYRPVVFVDGMRNWAPATVALGRHQVFGSVHVRDSDNELMSDLLHGPSAEIMSIARDGGRIFVPELEYGRVLDNYLDTRLDDFYLTELDDGNPLAPRLRLVCRLNPFRYINATLYLRKGTVRFRQKYATSETASDSDESCNRPVRFQQWLLDFSASNAVNTSAITDEPIAFIKAFTETFALPMAFKGWKPGGKPPWAVLLQRLNEMSRGIMKHLTPVHQALLALVDEETVKDGLETFQAVLHGASPLSAPVRGIEERKREAEERSLHEKGQPSFLVLVQAPTAVRSEELIQTVFDVKWLTLKTPEKRPAVIVEQEGGDEVQQRVTWNWSEDLRSLTIFGVDTENAQLGWVWLAEQNTLHVSLRKEKR